MAKQRRADRTSDKTDRVDAEGLQRLCPPNTDVTFSAI
jgi:hypothetical protein